MAHIEGWHVGSPYNFEAGTKEDLCCATKASLTLVGSDSGNRKKVRTKEKTSLP